MKLKVLNSQINNDINIIEEQLAGFIESRYVRKCDDYFICYLSSQTNCNRGCLFCHLTVTGQTLANDCSHNDFVSQAIQLFKHYRKQDIRAKWVNYNFMARGEPLANHYLLEEGDLLLSRLGQIAKEEGLPCKFNVSTIMPLTLKKSLSDIFNYIHPTIYYSMYSVNPAWRKKWMPAAMDVEQAVMMLKDYQKLSKKFIKIHYPFIAGENDSEKDINSVCDLLDKHNLICEFNLVRYNPYSPEQGKESSDEVIKRNMKILEERFSNFNSKVAIIPRVSPEIKASCGMFVE